MFMLSLKIAFAVALGFPALLFSCLFHAWTEPTFSSIKPWPSGTENVGPYRPKVDEWRWELLNKWYGNSEDGVSGAQAWVWQGKTLVPYYSTFPAWVPVWMKAYAWSAWRNNANNLKRAYRNDSLTGTVP